MTFVNTVLALVFWLLLPWRSHLKPHAGPSQMTWKASSAFKSWLESTHCFVIELETSSFGSDFSQSSWKMFFYLLLQTYRSPSHIVCVAKTKSKEGWTGSWNAWAWRSCACDGVSHHISVIAKPSSYYTLFVCTLLLPYPIELSHLLFISYKWNNSFYHTALCFTWNYLKTCIYLY